MVEYNLFIYLINFVIIYLLNVEEILIFHIQMKVQTTFKYGIVIIESYDKTLGYTVYEYRKPTIKERQEIILKYNTK